MIPLCLPCGVYALALPFALCCLEGFSAQGSQLFIRHGANSVTLKFFLDSDQLLEPIIAEVQPLHVLVAQLIPILTLFMQTTNLLASDGIELMKEEMLVSIPVDIDFLVRGFTGHIDPIWAIPRDLVKTFLD